MEEEFDQALLFETLAASLQLDKKETKQMIETLASILQGALPEQVSVKRGGWILSKEKPVDELLVKFEEVHYQIVKEGSAGSYLARELKVVRGIALKSKEMDLNDCVEKIVRQLSSLSEKNSRMKTALQKFIGG